MGAEASLSTRATPSRADSSCRRALWYISEASLRPRPAGEWRLGWLVEVDGEARGRRQDLADGRPPGTLRSASDRPGDLMVFRVHGGHQAEDGE